MSTAEGLIDYIRMLASINQQLNIMVGIRQSTDNSYKITYILFAKMT